MRGRRKKGSLKTLIWRCGNAQARRAASKLAEAEVAVEQATIEQSTAEHASAYQSAKADSLAKEALKQARPGRDGVTFEDAGYRLRRMKVLSERLGMAGWLRGCVS